MSPLVVIYSRISHDPEGRQLGVERQEQDCRRLAHQRGWTVLEPPYRENDISASTSTRKVRPVFDRMLTDLERGPAAVLLAYSTSRLTRRPSEYERLIALTARTGLTIQTVVSGPVQLDTADGRAIARVLAVIDAAEAERMSERVTRAKLQRAERGLWHGGRPPFGYTYRRDSEGLRLVPDDVQAALVREGCQRVTDGESLTAITRDWNRRGLRTAGGATWRPTGLRRTLIRPAVAGMTERAGRLHDGSWPPILTRGRWDAARTVLTDPRRHTRSFDQAARRYPLAGLLFCGLCDRMLHSNPLRGVPSFICSPTANGGCAKIRIQSSFVERFLLEAIRDRDEAGLDSPADARLRLALRQVQDDHYDGLVERSDYLRQVKRLRRSLDRRGHLRPTATAPDDDRRAVLSRALHRVDVLPHPKGQPTSHLDWPRRSAVLSERLRPHWSDDGAS